MNEFLQKGVNSVGVEKYFIYDSAKSNCQYWIQFNLKANNLWSSSVEKFTMQDTTSIYKNLGVLEAVNKGITDAAGIADHALYGGKKF